MTLLLYKLLALASTIIFICLTQKRPRECRCPACVLGPNLMHINLHRCANRQTLACGVTGCSPMSVATSFSCELGKVLIGELLVNHLATLRIWRHVT